MHVQSITFAILDDLECMTGPADRVELTEEDRVMLLRAASNSRHTFAGMDDDKPVFIGGVNDDGCVWMVATPDVAKCRKFYLRTTRQQIEIMQAMFPMLWTYVDERYTRSLRWLEWLGFKITETLTVNGVTARKVERVA